MLGQFWYKEAAPDDDVVLELKWVNEEPYGKVATPCWVARQPISDELGVKHEDEFMKLPFALSYGLLVAAASGARFTVSGDPTVWPKPWGNLLMGELRDLRVPAPISH
ncbi:hypothetical protein SAMN05216456_1574 [Devosia crocina]|uniref:Uncharacterized protein n=1 Tax=Devosia crocina TaxID=429728 RepID=A0A1I7NC17_9HYPH|nr:hypothetical protein SAMN05216456_1574 [Devosia crocina]